MAIDKDVFVQALEQAGVDNWEWYDESLSELSDEERKDNEAVYLALEAGGVDNWTWYGEAMDIYRTLMGEEEEPEPEVVVVEEVPEVQEIDPAEARLLRILGEEEYERLRVGFWRANHHPKIFKKSLLVIKNGGSKADARMVYLDLLYGENSGK